jgi:hypothetical protein
MISPPLLCKAQLPSPMRCELELAPIQWRGESSMYSSCFGLSIRTVQRSSVLGVPNYATDHCSRQSKTDEKSA